PTWLEQLPWLQSASQRQSQQPTLSGVGTTRMLREGARFLEALAENHPVILALEDLHWSDPETVDFVAMLAQPSRRGRILIVTTHRQVQARLAAHPIASAATSLLRQGGKQIIVEPFTRA